LAIAQGMLPWQLIKAAKSGVFHGKIFILVLPFQNGIEYRNVRVDAETPEKRLLIFVLL